MIKIKDIKAREILDSRGNPTVEVELITELGLFGASVPSGASVGKYEAKELRDGGERYKGKGVLKAIKNIEEIIAPKLIDTEIKSQKDADEILISLDTRAPSSGGGGEASQMKTKFSSSTQVNLGANAILPVSMAICRASAANTRQSLWQYINQIYGGPSSVNSVSLPIPCFNIINGGLHAGNDLDFQEFMVVPQLKSFSQNLQAGSEIYHTLKEILRKDFGETAINIGDEGGFAPLIKEPEEALDLIIKAIKISGYENKVNIALDVAASEFYKDQKYGVRSRDEMVKYYLELIGKYPITSIEDPFDEDDFEGFSILTNKCGDKVSIIGDDLLVTNIERIKEAQEKKACNGLLLKVNQIGTVTEAIEAAKLAKSYTQASKASEASKRNEVSLSAQASSKNALPSFRALRSHCLLMPAKRGRRDKVSSMSWKVMVSHRSGETTDDFIADLAVGIGADYIKSGAPARGERVVKYNRLLKIEKNIVK